MFLLMQPLAFTRAPMTKACSPTNRACQGDPVSRMLACCCSLGTACCLLAKTGRSTLDTKEGYKIKTGSTGTVTPTQT